jgi:hypothetical protein
MIFLSAQPYDPYFIWQVEVQIVNFRKHNISDKMHVLVWYLREGDAEEQHWIAAKPLWEVLQKKYPEVSFFFYEDMGVQRKFYISQLRPQIIAKHFDRYPELSKEAIFYHDSDIIFNYLPDFEKLIAGDICWQSDCSHYLDYKYLYLKEKQGKIPNREIICKMAEIGGISPLTIAKYRSNTGGAQCILKGVDGDFWRDVERMSLEIRSAFFYNVPGSINRRYFPNENTGLQSWCADMWALNFSLWKRGKVTSVTNDLAFSWATDSAETFHKKPIMHNAGATRMTPHIFYKGAWIDNSPIGKTLKVNKNTASYYYVQAINEVK